MQVSLWEVLKEVSNLKLEARKNIRQCKLKLNHLSIINAMADFDLLVILQKDLMKAFKDNVVEFDKNKDYNTCTCDTLVYDSVHNFNYCPACGTKIKWI